MGRTVICSCGQRNNLDTYKFGEPRLCVACGKELPHQPFELNPPAPILEEGFVPVATGFEDPDADESAVPLTGFETPTPTEALPEAAPAERGWQDGVREAPQASSDQPRCSRCRRPFRGEWDQHWHPDGALCHICATQADPEYKPPAIQARRELLRPVPPKRLAAGVDVEAIEKARKKKKEIILLASVAAAVLILVNVLPVETWMAMFFSADLSKAEGLPAAWNWAVRIANFSVSTAANMIALYLALTWSRLLHEGGLRENIFALLYLGVAFALMNLFVSFAATYFAAVFSIMAPMLVGMAMIITLMIKLLMIAGQFHLRMESAIGFFLAWTLSAILMKPLAIALHQLVHGIVAAIAL